MSFSFSVMIVIFIRRMFICIFYFLSHLKIKPTNMKYKIVNNFNDYIQYIALTRNQGVFHTVFSSVSFFIYRILSNWKLIINHLLIYLVYYVRFITFHCYNHSGVLLFTRADGFSLEFKWQVSRNLLSILADLNHDVQWVVSAHPFITKSFSRNTNPSITVPRATITIDINVTFMFHSFWSRR